MESCKPYRTCGSLEADEPTQFKVAIQNLQRFFQAGQDRLKKPQQRRVSMEIIKMTGTISGCAQRPRAKASVTVDVAHLPLQHPRIRKLDEFLETAIADNDLIKSAEYSRQFQNTWNPAAEMNSLRSDEGEEPTIELLHDFIDETLIGMASKITLSPRPFLRMAVDSPVSDGDRDSNDLPDFMLIEDEEEDEEDEEEDEDMADDEASVAQSDDMVDEGDVGIFNDPEFESQHMEEREAFQARNAELKAELEELVELVKLQELRKLEQLEKLEELEETLEAQKAELEELEARKAELEDTEDEEVDEEHADS